MSNKESYESIINWKQNKVYLKRNLVVLIEKWISSASPFPCFQITWLSSGLRITGSETETEQWYRKLMRCFNFVPILCDPMLKAGFPLGEFVRANREKKQLDWLVTNTDVITSQSHSLFACSRE